MVHGAHAKRAQSVRSAGVVPKRMLTIREKRHLRFSTRRPFAPFSERHLQPRRGVSVPRPSGPSEFWKHVEDWVPALTPYYFPKLFERVPGARVEIQKNSV